MYTHTDTHIHAQAQEGTFYFSLFLYHVRSRYNKKKLK